MKFFVLFFSPFLFCFLDCVPLSFSTFRILFSVVLCRALLTSVILLSSFPVFFLYFKKKPMS